MIPILFTAVSISIFCLSLYVLVIGVKDVRVRKDHPYLGKWIVKAPLIGILVSQAGYLFLTGDDSAWWLVFNASVGLLLIAFVVGFKKKYQDIEIHMSDGSELVNIPTDKYGIIADGFEARVYTGGPLITRHEEAIMEAIKDFDLSLYHVIFLDADVGSEFIFHFHLKREWIISASGEAIIHPGKPPCSPTNRINTPPEIDHYFEALTEFHGVALLEK